MIERDDPEGLPRLGAGAQYTVFDAGGGRVLKTPNSLELAYQAFLVMGESAEEAHQKADECLRARDSGVPMILRLAVRYPALGPALASPIAAGGAAYTQDRVQPMGEVLEQATNEEIPALIEGLAQCFLACWRYGIHDYLYNFDGNNGVCDGRVVLMDFGETASFTPLIRTWASEATCSAKFRQSTHQQDALPEEMHDVYTDIMDRRLSVEQFDVWWAADLTDLATGAPGSPDGDRRARRSTAGQGVSGKRDERPGDLGAGHI